MKTVAIIINKDNTARIENIEAIESIVVDSDTYPTKMVVQLVDSTSISGDRMLFVKLVNDI